MSTDDHHKLFICWALNQPDNEEQVREIAEKIAAQRDIPGVLQIEAGPRERKVHWEGPESDFDYAMALTLDSWEAVEAYPPHPIHLELVDAILKYGTITRGGHWIKIQ